MPEAELTVFSDNVFAQMNERAAALAAATLLPEHLRQGKDGRPLPAEARRANCLLVVNAARLWNLDPFQLAGETFVVGGKLDFQGKVYAALANARGGLSRKLDYKYTGGGETRKCTVSGTLAHEADPRAVVVEYRKVVTKDRAGKVTKQWADDPDRQLRYSGARAWVRTHCPEVMLGIVSEERAEAEQPGEPGEAEPLREIKMIESRRRSWLELLDSCGERQAVENTVALAKQDVTLSEDELEAVVEHGRACYAALPARQPEQPAEPAESSIVADALLEEEKTEAYQRWERTLLTTETLERLRELRPVVAADETLSGGERQLLDEIVGELLKGVG